MPLVSRSDAFTLLVDADPNTGPGIAAPIGYQAQHTGTGTLWQKTGVANTDWTQCLFSGASGDPFWTGIIPAGRRLSNAGCTSLTSGVMTANQIRAYPFVYPGGRSYSQAQIEVTTAVAGSNFRFGIYNDNNGLPGSLFIEFTSGGPVSGGTIGLKTIVTPFTLTSGRYWFSAIGDNGAVQLRNVNFINGFGMYGHDSTGTSSYGFLQSTLTFGPLPATFPGSFVRQAGGCFAMWIE